MPISLSQTLERIRSYGRDESSSETSSSPIGKQESILRPVMPELDTVRGLAILLVLFYHGFYWQTDLTLYSPFERLFIIAMWAGRLGVNLFFVLSGFLITGLLLESRSRQDYYKRFYIRRALRILPAYGLVVLVLALTRYASLKFLIMSAAYLANLTPLFGIAIGYSVLWSLAVEEHFYFLWPAAVRNLSTRWLLGIGLTIVALSPVSRLLTFYLGRQNGYVSFQLYDYTWNSADGLACGVILCILLYEFTPSRRLLFRISCTLLLISAAIWALGAPFGIVTRQRPLGAALQVVPWQFAFTALLGLFLLAGTGRYAAMVRLRPLRFFGEISYGLYLVHLLIFDSYDWFVRRYGWQPIHAGGRFGALTFRFLCAGIAATVVAYFSRRYFEEPFLRLKNRMT